MLLLGKWLLCARPTECFYCFIRRRKPPMNGGSTPEWATSVMRACGIQDAQKVTGEVRNKVEAVVDEIKQRIAENLRDEQRMKEAEEFIKKLIEQKQKEAK